VDVLPVKSSLTISLGGKTIRLRGDCLPSVFIDRARAPNTESIDLLVSTYDVEAVEVFHGFDLPVEYGVNPFGVY